MTEETVKEMKRTAFIEGAMHEHMKVNFDEGYSPSDPEHYQKIYSWGRKLSGRARAQVAFEGRLGALTTTNAVSAARSDIEAINSITKDFVHSLGQQAYCPRPRYKYGDAPLWLNVGKNIVKEYIEAIMPHYPEETRLSMRAMVREIEDTVPLGEEDARWNVVIGEPARLWKDSFPMGLDRDIRAGNPKSAKIESGVIRYGSVRTDMAFYAMIETRHINMADATMLEEGLKNVTSAIERKKKKHILNADGHAERHYTFFFDSNSTQSTYIIVNLIRQISICNYCSVIIKGRCVKIIFIPRHYVFKNIEIVNTNTIYRLNNLCPPR